MTNELIKLALEQWAEGKGYESFSKVLPRAPEIIGGSDEWLKTEGVLFLLRPSLVELVRTGRIYFTEDGKSSWSNRRKSPAKRGYTVAVWASPSGTAYITKFLMCEVGASSGSVIGYGSEDGLVQSIDKSYGFLNRDQVFHSAVEIWLSENEEITDWGPLEFWPIKFDDPVEMIVPFAEWSFVKYSVEGFDDDHCRYVGVTNDGHLSLFFPSRGGGVYTDTPIQSVNSGDEVARVLDKMYVEGEVTRQT